jgi:hypothetical protein
MSEPRFSQDLKDCQDFKNQQNNPANLNKSRFNTMRATARTAKLTWYLSFYRAIIPNGIVLPSVITCLFFHHLAMLKSVFSFKQKIPFFRGFWYGNFYCTLVSIKVTIGTLAGRYCFLPTLRKPELAP